MRYYLIAGEASGDLHASRLMEALKQEDRTAEFRFYGGDKMAAVGGTLVKHYRELAYMGFMPVLMHLPAILRNMRQAKRDIATWHPDAVILVDYPGFNLSIAKYVKARHVCPVYYYISPKIWAWKEYRIKRIKRDIDELFSILPFEVDFFERKHHYPIHYVGNPTVEEVNAFKNKWHTMRDTFYHSNDIPEGKPILALLCGSRKQEIKDNLPTMLQVADRYHDDYTIVVAGAPGIDSDYYKPFIDAHHALFIQGQTYDLLCEARAALVTSGTATLETALFGVPQVVCYETPLPKLLGYLRRRFLKVKYVSLVNLIADREVVREMVADTFTPENIMRELEAILYGNRRTQITEGYAEVKHRLGKEIAPQNAAHLIVDLLSGSQPAQQQCIDN